MSKYIKQEDLKWHSPDESIVKPLTEFYVTESDIADLPTIEINEDCISREQFREQMYHRCIEVDNDPNMQKWDSGNWLRWKLFEEELENAPSVVPKPREGEWIPCSERLPHAEYGESDNVLVTCESKCIRLLYFNGGNWCYPTGEYYGHRIDKVVAWMPLPEPWKGVSDEH